jgi:flagellar biosynthetic protein FliQ
MSVQFAIDILRMALWNALVIALAPLGAGLVVGLAISIFQTATNIQEQTLTFVPKIISLILVMLFVGPWIITRLMEFTIRIWELMGRVSEI